MSGPAITQGAGAGATITVPPEWFISISAISRKTYHQAVFVQTNIRNGSSTFKSDYGMSGPMPDTISGSTASPLAPRQTPVVLAISAYYSESSTKLSANAIRDSQYASSKVDIHSSTKPPTASPTIPDYVTYYIFVEDIKDSAQVAGSGQFGDAVVTVHLVKTNPNPIPLPPPDKVIKGDNSLFNMASRIKVVLSDVKFLSGSGEFIKASVDANIVNTTSSDIKFSGDIDVVYGSTKIGRVLHTPEGLSLKRGYEGHDYLLSWKFEPGHSANEDVIKFFKSYFSTGEILTLELRVDRSYCDPPGMSEPPLVLNPEIEGIGHTLVTNVSVYLGLNLALNSVSFEFQFHNPFDMPLAIRGFKLKAKIQGTDIASVDNSTQQFELPANGLAWSKRASANLLKDIFTSALNGLNPNNNLDIEVTHINVRIGSYDIDNLKFDFDRVPFTVKPNFRLF